MSFSEKSLLVSKNSDISLAIRYASGYLISSKYNSVSPHAQGSENPVNFAEIYQKLNAAGLRDDQIIKEIVKSNKLIYCTYVVYEPNMFDKKDIEYVNKSGFNDKGRMSITWINENGNIRRNTPMKESTLSSETNGFWYLQPIRTQKELITEPYLYSYTEGQEAKLVVSVVVPLIKNGKSISVDIYTKTNLHLILKTYKPSTYL